MLEEFIALASIVGTVTTAINSIIELNKNISGICQAKSPSSNDIKEKVSKLEKLGVNVKKLGNNKFYTTDLLAVKNTSENKQHIITDLNEANRLLTPIQHKVGRDILSSGLIVTPDKFRNELNKDPWNVLSDITPIEHYKPIRDPNSAPVYFQYNNVSYIGWIKKGLIPSVFNCKYDEFWISNSYKTPSNQELSKNHKYIYSQNFNTNLLSTLLPQRPLIDPLPNIPIINWYMKKKEKELKAAPIIRINLRKTNNYLDENIIYYYNIYTSPNNLSNLFRWEDPLELIRSIRKTNTNIRFIDKMDNLKEIKIGEIAAYKNKKTNKIHARYKDLNGKWSTWESLI